MKNPIAAVRARPPAPTEEQLWDDTSRRLSELGMVPGTVVQNAGRLALLVSVHVRGTPVLPSGKYARQWGHPYDSTVILWCDQTELDTVPTNGLLSGHWKRV